MAETTHTPAAPAAGVDVSTLAPGKFFVEKKDCIACDACANDFPDLFFMTWWQGERKAEEVADKIRSAADTDVWKVIKICPTGAIKFDGGLPPEPVEEVSLEIVDGWEEKWHEARRKRRILDTVDERNRRYGLEREVLDYGERMVVRVKMPTIVPELDLKYKYGLGDDMPDYKYDVQLVTPTKLQIKCWLDDPKVKVLCYKANAFPEQFTVNLDLPAPATKIKDRYSEYNIQIVCFKSEKAAEEYVWPSHFITTDCTGCMICLTKCPTSAITGDRDRRHFINEELCINCRACGTYCPFHAIQDDRGTVVTYVKPKEVPKAQVIDELCTGCSFCVDVCPVDCITLVPEANGIPGSPVHIVARVDERACVSCKICEHVCIKDAIVVPNEVPFQDNIGWSFQYPPASAGRIIGSYSDQVSADAPLVLAQWQEEHPEDPAVEK